MSLKEMKDELRKLRKDTVKPVSRMRKADIASELERLRGKREDIPPVASVTGAKPKKMEAKIADVKVAKEKEFPMKPMEELKVKKGKGSALSKTTTDSAPKKKSKLDRLIEMMDTMSDTDDE